MKKYIEHFVKELMPLTYKRIHTNQLKKSKIKEQKNKAGGR